MSVAETKLDSLRPSGLENRRLALALALSLAVHLLTWGGYAAGQKFGWWTSFHWPTWLHRLTQKITPVPVLPVANNQEPPLTFVTVDEPSADAPKDAKYYSSRNSRAANPEATRDTNIPKINGKQTDVPKTENVPKPDFNKLQLTPRPAVAKNQEQQQSKPQLAMNSDPRQAPAVHPTPTGAAAAETPHPQPGARPIGPTTPQHPNAPGRRDASAGARAIARRDVDPIWRL